jgi:RimJ/RimL family protein N-acetyltransferase
LAWSDINSKNKRMKLEPAGTAQAELILSLFESSPSYFLKVEGGMPTLTTVEDALKSQPKKTGPGYLKEFFIIRDLVGHPIGTAELHINHPERGIAYLGLLQIRGTLAGQGVGRAAYHLVERHARDVHGCNRMRLGVSNENDVSGFWSKLGFKNNGHTYSWMGEHKANQVVEYEKNIEVADAHRRA